MVGDNYTSQCLRCVCFNALQVLASEIASEGYWHFVSLFKRKSRCLSPRQMAKTGQGDLLGIIFLYPCPYCRGDVMTVNKVELIIDELYDAKVGYKADSVYYKLYQEFDEKFKTIFAYFHSEFNHLFSFMNDKNKLNKHFNADPSRQLLKVIKEFNDFYNILIGSEKQIDIDERYLATIKRCEDFLDMSGGSAIPDDFNLIEIIRYEPIFAIAAQEIRVTEERYNLIISGNDEAWDTDSSFLDVGRFLEYTEKDIEAEFSKLNREIINEIIKYPCIFAYEDGCKKDGYVGYITDMIVRQGMIKITIKKVEIITAQNLQNLKFELDIHDWELSRTHWAIKKVNLYNELQSMGINLNSVNQIPKLVDINKHIFDVAVTFAGESRNLVEQVVRELEKLKNKDSIFYDNNFISQLARPSLDVLLQDIYRNRSKLIVVFLCEKYQDKEWCGLEFRAIRDLIKSREDKIMYIKLDDGHVDGVLKIDGYIDGNKFSPQEIANFINERIILSSSQ